MTLILSRYLLQEIIDNTNNTATNTNIDAPDFNLDTFKNVDSEKTEFNTLFEDTMSNTFIKYENVFGFDGYSQQPANITFSLMSQTFTIIDFNVLSPYIDNIRTVLIAFSYIWGILIIFRTV